jgi:2-polyprenylphenol hydroxylase and related flavodoxin oxidoreductases
MNQDQFTINENRPIAEDIFLMLLDGTHAITAPGQFVQIALDGFYLRRPISICDYDAGGFSIIYKVVGGGTAAMSKLTPGNRLDIITGLGNGFNVSLAEKPLLIGGGVGVPPLYKLAKDFRAAGKDVGVILGFNRETDVFYHAEFKALGCTVLVTTVHQSRYIKGVVTDALALVSAYDFYYTCGSEPMLRAVYDACPTPGQLSFESRMACGFGACMGCSCKTKYGAKRICKDGPVLNKEEIVW